MPRKTGPAFRTCAASGSRVGDEQLEVLGRVVVRARDRLVAGDATSSIRDAGRSRGAATASASSALVGHQDRLAVGAVLGLGEQVGGARGRVGGLVGDHEHLARPGGQVDRDAARDEQLRRGHPPVAGPDDLGDRRDRLGAVGERGDRLRAADRVHLVDAELARRSPASPPSGRGVATAIRVTPATRAGTAVITQRTRRAPAGT